MEKNKEHSASALGNNLDISRKQCVEIGKFIRGRDIEKALGILEQVIEKKTAVPYRKYNKDIGHKKGGIGPGRYPVKAANFVVQLINAAKSNAENKGLDGEKLYIKQFMANKGNTAVHHGRHQGRKMKRTHIKIILEERENKKPKREGKK